ncbi:hypothetical protein EJV47_03260 [Hymenobacter gummosus]|uniref:DUF3300 domain-containing protein n=1 Tax=Hymenobacter gummosus TaxID=1776032 RepID=A0A431UAA6_9BACT|nr:hypothetical protein [Hymenobacter gummosus]RTQ53766.1 hypothetical protein EJV47_03260 [Hymenobacter gummosus]
MRFLLKPALPLVLLALLFGSSPAQAQVQVNVNVGAPAWGPAVGPGVQYYYIPEIDGYYDLYTQSYVYFDPYYNAWVSTPALPAYYAGYDPRYFHPVVVQYVGRQPWGLIYDHRAYCNTRGWRPGYYRSAPGPRWQPGGYANGYRNQPGRYDNRPYSQNGPGRGGYDRYDNNRNGRYDQDDRRGGYDGRRDTPGNGRPDFGQGQPGRGQGNGPGGNGGFGNGNGPGGRRGQVR